MDSKRPPSRPNTLGQAWRRASQPRRGQADNLPPLPDWPPMRDERLEDRAGDNWPSLGPSPSIGSPDRDYQRDPHDARDPEPAQRKPDPQRPALELWRRWRGASRKVQALVVAAILLPLLLIAGCSSLALHALGGIGGSSLPLTSAQATQQASAVNGTPGAATATHAPTTAPTAAPTRAPTSAPSAPLTLSITCASGAIHGTGKVCVRTQPSAALSISVKYCDGTSAKGLHAGATADSSGAYTGTWPVRSACVGAATATVTAQWQGQKVTQTQTFTITP